MDRRAFLKTSTATALGVAAAVPTRAQTYPSRQITFVVPYSVGGSTDAAARIMAQAIGTQTGAPAIVENRTGAGGAIGWGSVARAAPDGYTVLTTELTYSLAPSVVANLPFDPGKALTHVGLATAVPHVLVVNPAIEAKTFAEFIALAGANPDKMNYGSGGNGSNTHVGFELIKHTTGIKVGHVPYRGAGAAITDLIGGQVQALVTAVPTAISHIRSGKLRPLLVMNDARVPELPDVPSAADVGQPRLFMTFWVGFSVPAGTPGEVVERLNREIGVALKNPDVVKRLGDLGFAPAYSSAAGMQKLVSDETARWATIIKAAGIKAE